MLSMPVYVKQLVCRETEKPLWTIMYFLFILILRMQKKFCKDEIFGGNDPSSRQDSVAFKLCAVVEYKQAFGGSGDRWEKSNITAPKEIVL